MTYNHFEENGKWTMLFEVYTSNDNCVYDKVEQVIVSRDEREDKEVLRFTFDSVECTYVKIYGTIVMTYIGYGASGDGDFVDNDILAKMSTDGGNTWAQPEAVEGLVTPSSTNTIVTIHATGDVLLIWNDEYATDNGNRNPLTFAVSSDHGLTYKNKKNTIEAGASWPVMTFYGRRAYMQPSSGVKVCDVEELYYAVSGVKTVADLPKAPTPAATYENGWLNGVSNTMCYSIDGGATWKFCGGTSVQIGDITSLMVKDIGTHETAPSDIQTVK